MNDFEAIIILVLLLAGNAFFVAAEFAMVSARREQLEPRAETGSWPARMALRGVENVSISLAATQLGITACSLLIGAVGEPAIAHLIDGPLTRVGIPSGLVHPIALIIALVIVTFLHMVLGEMVPKNIAIAKPAASALLLGPVLHVVVILTRPVIWLMNETANLVVRHVFRAEPRDEVASAFTSDELVGFVEESGREGLLDEDEMALLSGALSFESLNAGDVAIPLGDLVTVPNDALTGDVHDASADTGYSRFPVRKGEDLIGYIHVKDLLRYSPDVPMPKRFIRELADVPADMKLADVMSYMQSKHAHMALVTAGGEATGLVALEDVLEELVGEVRDATTPGVGSDPEG